MIINYTRPAGRAAPRRMTSLVVAIIVTLALSTGLHAGASAAMNQPPNSLESSNNRDKTTVHENNSEDLTVNLLFHLAQKNGADRASVRENVLAIVGALNRFYWPRGVRFQYEMEAFKGSVVADIEVRAGASDRPTTTDGLTESVYNVYFWDESCSQLSGAEKSSEANYTVLSLAPEARFERSALVKTLGRSIALWHTRLNSPRLRDEADGYTDSARSVGDIDGNGQGPDIADLVYMVDFMFRGGPKPATLEAADLVGPVGTVDVADLVKLIEHLFGESSGRVEDHR